MREDIRHKILAILLWAGSLFLLASLFTFTPHDIAWESAPVNRPLHNSGGIIGAYVAYGLFKGFGWSTWFLALLVGIWGWMCWQRMSLKLATMRILGTAVFLLASSALWGLGAMELGVRLERGGLLGVIMADWLYKYLGLVGAHLVGWCVAFLALLAITDFLVLTWTIAGTRTLWGLGRSVWMERRAKRMRATAAAARSAPPETLTLPARPATTAPRPEPPAEKLLAPQPRVIKTVTPKPQAGKAALPKPHRVMMPAGSYQLPPIDLLATPPPISQRQIQDNLEANSRLLEDTLRDFEIQAQVVEVEKGPAITRYELQPEPGTKVSRIASLSEEIALMMKAQSVRVAAIPGKSRVGIEVPNTTSSIVYLREVIESPAFQRAPSKLTMALGKTVSGDILLTDLRDCPHILIAGTTGSGKTVCLNAIITGFLYRALPADLRLLLIDPKMVEMAAFNDLPHLLVPVVTHAKKAAAVLEQTVQEMERRYKLLAEAGVRNIDGYNERLKAQGSRLKAESESVMEAEGEETLPLPYIVVVIDELADLMVVAANEVEAAIMRLAQLSRAVGIHLIMATQRPSVDVITGVIKANLPARISFQVASKVDSRTVLDMIGADKLLGRGDLLFLNPGSAKPVRAQGCFLTDAEMERIVAHCKTQQAAAYDEEFMALQEKSGATVRGERDEFFEEAKQVVLQTGQASTSMLQRRLRLGYTRAARLLDQLEEAGIVGPPRGAKPRDILIERPVGAGANETVEDSA